MYKWKDEVGTFHGCLGLPQEFETVSHGKRIEERIAIIHCLDFLFSHKIRSKFLLKIFEGWTIGTRAEDK